MENNNVYQNLYEKYGTNLSAISKKEATPRSSTGVRGVYRMWDGSYQARIQMNRKEVILLCTKVFEDAVKARKDAEKEIYDPIVELAIKNGDFSRDE